jgi:hypothetical protein
MRIASILCTVLALSYFSTTAFSQTTLDKVKTQDILKQLTSQSYTTWVSAGTIEATHQEYGVPKVTDSATINAEIAKAIRQYQENPNKRELTPEAQKMALDAIPFNVEYGLANEYSMTSRHTVKYDGKRFYWEINVSSRSDSVKPDASLAANDMTDDFDMATNQRRIFAWDGQKYTTYAVSGGQAIVDTAGKLGTPVVTGPLTAGLIPWGNGKFTYDSLSTASVTAAQASVKSSSLVQMSIAHDDGTTSDLVLDSSKAYAVTSATLTSPSGMVVTYTLSGHKLIGGRWVPSSVAIERQNVPINGQVPTSEEWTFTSVSATTPSLSSFNVSVAMDDTIEYVAPMLASSAIYANSYEADTDELLAERVAYDMGKDSRRQNCATAAISHVAAAFGKPVSSAAMASLVDSDGGTSLYKLKQFAQGLGLYSRVVKTDLAALESLGTAKAILHIPGKNHFVVIDHVDDQYVWLVDLSSRKFYYRQSVHFFPLEWTDGTALLVSDRPLSGQFTELPERTTKQLTGATTYYACNTLMQELSWVTCAYVSGVCQGYTTIYWERWTCGQAASGTCTYQSMLFRQRSPCMLDPYVGCTYTGEWIYQNTSQGCE